MGRVCMGRVCYGPSLSWAEFVMGRVVQLPLENDTGYPHDGRANNAAYRHDRRADKRRYSHDREIDIQMFKMFRNGYILR